MSTRLHTHLLAVAALLLGGIPLSAGLQATAARADGSFTSTGVTPTGQPWLGFGANEYPLDRDSSDNDIPWTSSDFALTTSRLGFMRPGLTRINVFLGWFNPSGDLSTFDWNTWPMDNLYQLLSWYNSNGLKVQIGMWHDVLNGPPDDLSVYTSTAWADVQAALINQLVNVEGYTNIYGYAGINEWNCSYMFPPGGASLSQWQTATQNLQAAFAADGLSTALLGPDTGCGGSSVDIPAAQTESSALSAYEDHYYPSASQINGDNVESTYASIVSSVDSADPGRKPVYVGEMGVSDPDYNPSPPIDSYAYGLDMFDYGVQVLRSGAAGALAWCLDGFDVSKNCGMWNISGADGGTTLRPWFYTWSLLSRFFPPDATVYTMPAPAKLRIAAASVPTGSASSNWTFALVNRNSTNAQAVTLKVPGWGSGEFDEYVYSPSSQTTDANGFPTPYQQLWTHSGGLKAGLTVTVPPGSAVLLTTLNRSPVPEITQPPTGHEIALQASNGYYVSAWQSDPNTPLEARSAHVQAWETFDLVNAGNGYVALRAHTNNLYVSAWLGDPDTPLEARSATTIQNWEEFKMIYNANGAVSFQAAANGDYVSAWQSDPNTPLQARATQIQAWEEYNLSVLN